MRPANKIQNKIYPTRSRSVHPSFPLLSNSLGATVHRGNVVLLFPPKNVEVLNVSAVGKGWRGSSWWLAAAGYGSGSSGAHPGCPGSHMSNRQQPPSLGPGATMQMVSLRSTAL